MKIKTSITLSKELLEAVDEQSGPHGNRSEFIENALRTYLGQMLLLRQNARDLDIINREADHLNDEANDVLTYQRQSSASLKDRGRILLPH
jgi:metal-responsive CopG/Arc/MetJ family transcriptional regulator